VTETITATVTAIACTGRNRLPRHRLVPLLGATTEPIASANTGKALARVTAVSSNGYEKSQVVRNPGGAESQYWQRSTTIALACTRKRPPATASRCRRRALASNGSAVSTTISQLPPYVGSGSVKAIGR